MSETGKANATPVLKVLEESTMMFASSTSESALTPTSETNSAPVSKRLKMADPARCRSMVTRAQPVLMPPPPLVTRRLTPPGLKSTSKLDAVSSPIDTTIGVPSDLKNSSVAVAAAPVLLKRIAEVLI